MAKTDEKVMAQVEAELDKNPDASLDELFAKAKEVSSGVGKLTRRQFNARYPLQVKRRKQREASGTKRPARKTRGRRTARKPSETAAAAAPAAPSADVNRDAVRDSFLKFATELAAADSRKDVVKVLAGVDKYVDQVVKATGR